jgi:hypothetical protein
MPPRQKQPDDEQTAKAAMPDVLPCPCPCCGGRMIVIEVIARSCQPGYRPPVAPIIRLDTS